MALLAQDRTAREKRQFGKRRGDVRLSSVRVETIIGGIIGVSGTHSQGGGGRGGTWEEIEQSTKRFKVGGRKIKISSVQEEKRKKRYMKGSISMKFCRRSESNREKAPEGKPGGEGAVYHLEKRQGIIACYQGGRDSWTLGCLGTPDKKSVISNCRLPGTAASGGFREYKNICR